MESGRRSFAWALGLAIVAVLLAGCARGAGTERPSVDTRPDPVVTLTSLHDKLVYVVETTADIRTQTYRLFWIDPVEKQPHLLLTTTDPATEKLTTLYLPGRDKMLSHMAPSGNTKTGNDYVAGIDGSDPKLLLRGHVTDIFPDGKRLLVVSDLDEGGQTYFLYTADLSGKILKRLTFRPKGVTRRGGSEYLYEGDWGGVVSPDGTSIVYSSSWYAQRSLRNDLFRIKSDGAGWTRLTDGRKAGATYGVEAFSHDGAHLAVTELRAYGTDREQAYLSFMDLEGHVLRRLPLGDDGGGFTFGGWSPDDRKVAIVTAGDRIDVLDTKAGGSTPLVTVDETAGESITSLAWLE